VACWAAFGLARRARHRKPTTPRRERMNSSPAVFGLAMSFFMVLNFGMATIFGRAVD